MSGSPERIRRRAVQRAVAARDGSRTNVLGALARKVDGAIEEAATLPRPEAARLLRERENVWRTQALAARNGGDERAAETLEAQAARLHDTAAAYGPADHPGVHLV